MRFSKTTFYRLAKGRQGESVMTKEKLTKTTRRPWGNLRSQLVDSRFKAKLKLAWEIPLIEN